jgi:hypothetical protein
MTLQILDLEKSEELSKEKMAETTGGWRPSYGDGGYGDGGYRHDCYRRDSYRYDGYRHDGYRHDGNFFNQQFNGGINVGNGVDNTNFI